MKLPDKIFALRKSKGLSQEDLAEKMNVSRQTVSRWEVGSVSPDADNLKQLSNIFGVTVDYLLNDEYETNEDIHQAKDDKTPPSKNKNISPKALLITSIAFGVAALAFLIKAIDQLNIIYVILAVVDAIMSLVWIILYERIKKQSKDI